MSITRNEPSHARKTRNYRTNPPVIENTGNPLGSAGYFRKKMNLTSEKYRVPPRPTPPNRLPTLSRNNPLGTLFFYVSDLRRPASSSPSSGDQCAAGPGLNRFCKSNERMPAAVPAGFFIAPDRFARRSQHHDESRFQQTRRPDPRRHSGRTRPAAFSWSAS